MKKGLWYATDKALYDALNNRKFTNSQLSDLFYSRGVLLSSRTPRERLASYFSRLNHDYYDHQNIAATFATGLSREKMTMTFVSSDISQDDIDQSVQAVKESLEMHGDLVEIHASEKTTNLKVHYTVFDTNKTEFKQVVDKEALISIEPSSSGVLIRSPNNERVESIKSQLLDSMSERTKKSAEELDISNIELTGIEDPQTASDFFLHLVEGLNGAVLDSVTGVSVYNSAESGDEADKTPRISDLSFRGQRVSHTDQLPKLIKEGFYICSITWNCLLDNANSDLYSLEAKFENPREKSEFSYLAKSMRKHKGGADFNKTSQKMSYSDELKFHRLIEDAARAALQEIA